MSVELVRPLQISDHEITLELIFQKKMSFYFEISLYYYLVKFLFKRFKILKYSSDNDKKLKEIEDFKLDLEKEKKKKITCQ